MTLQDFLPSKYRSWIVHDFMTGRTPKGCVGDWLRGLASTET
jgi:hypothetical protein